MAKVFGGFTQEQTEILARKMGFAGPMDKFNDYVNSDPAHSEKLNFYTEKAKQLVSGEPPKGFAGGGLITDTPLPTPPLPLTGTQLTNGLINKTTNLTTPVAVTEAVVSPNEVVDPNSGNVPTNSNVVTQTGGVAQAADAPVTTAAPQVVTASTQSGLAGALDPTVAAKGVVSADSKVEAATALPSSDATVQGQLTKLMTQFDGGAVPAWAAGAIRNANAISASRGLGSSSIASSAVTQATMESAISIAAADASTFSQFELTNLNNRQQARLQNAQAFLTMDMANLDNEQQVALFKAQSRVQSLFTDQAAENASRQFNASSQSQTDQFFAGLKTQVATFNAAQTNAMKQFNAEQGNSVEMFNRQMADARDQFEVGNRLIIDQSNATWRRSVTTTNNATINEANRINAQSATQMTTIAYNNLMQRERDLYTFAYESAENAGQRAHEVVMAKMQAKANRRAAVGEAVGSLLATGIGEIFK